MLYYDVFGTVSLLHVSQMATSVSFLPAELGRRVMRANSPEERARRAGGYILLEKMIKRHTKDFQNAFKGIVKPEFGAFFDRRDNLSCLRYDAYGKPYLDGHDNLAFNLSHAGHLAACALHITAPDEVASSVGIDVEQVICDRERAARMANRYFSEAERELLATATEEDAYCAMFTRIWTRKEALLKQMGLGLSAISRADSCFPDEHGCAYLEREIDMLAEFPSGKTEQQHYFLTVCAEKAVIEACEAREKAEEVKNAAATVDIAPSSAI